MGRVSVTFSYSFRCLTTETVNYINENGFIENLAASKLGVDRYVFFRADADTIITDQVDP